MKRRISQLLSIKVKTNCNKLLLYKIIRRKCHYLLIINIQLICSQVKTHPKSLTWRPSVEGKKMVWSWFNTMCIYTTWIVFLTLSTTEASILSTFCWMLRSSDNFYRSACLHPLAYFKTERKTTNIVVVGNIWTN